MLSDVLGDIPDMIASGPTCPDPSDSVRAAEIIDRYKIKAFRTGTEIAEKRNTETVT